MPYLQNAIKHSSTKCGEIIAFLCSFCIKYYLFRREEVSNWSNKYAMTPGTLEGNTSPCRALLPWPSKTSILLSALCGT